MRTIMVCDSRWQFFVGRDAVVLRDAIGRRRVVLLSELDGRDAYTLARGRWKKTTDGMVTPGQIAAYLTTHCVFPPPPRRPTRRAHRMRFRAPPR